MQLDKFFLKFGLASATAELVALLVVLLGVSAVFWFLVGRFRLHNFLINIYISFSLVQVVPKDILPLPKNSSVLLFVIFVVLLTLINRYLFDIHQYGSGLAIWQVLVMSFLEVVLLLSIILAFMPAKDVFPYFSKNSLGYFVDPWWRVGWMVAPLLFLVFVKKRNE
jgi:hypothetical protein